MSRLKTNGIRPVRWALLAAAIVAGLYAGIVHGQAQDGFVKATDITKESLPASPLLYTAYAIVWVVLIGYVFMLWRRLDRVERELRDVTARLAGKR